MTNLALVILSVAVGGLLGALIGRLLVALYDVAITEPRLRREADRVLAEQREWLHANLERLEFPSIFSKMKQSHEQEGK